jgi:hypothetical protein
MWACTNAVFRGLGLLAASVLLSTVLGAPGARALSPELKCQDAIAKTARNYFKKHFTAVSKCENKRAEGSAPPATECRRMNCVGGDRDGLGCATDLECPGGSCQTNPLFDADTADALADAAAKLPIKLAAKCADPLPGGVLLGIPCGTAASLSVADVADCIVNEAHGVNAERLLSTVYDESGAIDDEGVRLCQEKIAKESRNFAKKRETRRRACAKKLAAGKIEPPCPDAKARAAMDKDLAKFRAKVLEACSATQVLDASKDFGFPVNDPAQPTSRTSPSTATTPPSPTTSSSSAVSPPWPPAMPMPARRWPIRCSTRPRSPMASPPATRHHRASWPGRASTARAA